MYFILKDEIPKVVGTAHQIVRNIEVEDKTGSIQVALWNDITKSPVKSGDHVKITHVSPKNNKFQQRLTLTTTKDTHIDVCIQTIAIILLVQLYKIIKIPNN